ncbi:ribosomal-protein-alanine N-acetyltransferase [Fictibacillus solisalsi]|uniref:Ribosomal-protein-alanine N-acetyltransferase n=1 Tax=Fictibacillus solisalsi TaxID=459525 RepID=A0A1G9TPP7_9BACL|nr:GNAT family N-acetyltransferase [Fictibacillus solisalsi]SDM49631.1 ribosomal-protein-alanine N-acetyltransferase [Fictibacillus solisalsi]
MKLETKRLTLIPCTRPYVASLSEDEYPLGGHIASHLKKLDQDPEEYGWGVWLVAEKETGRIVGDIGFKGKPDAEKKVEVGYGFEPAARNQGYATESVEKLIQWAFTRNGVKRIIAECLSDNGPSVRVLEKLEMKRTGQEGDMVYWELKEENNE